MFGRISPLFLVTAVWLASLLGEEGIVHAQAAREVSAAEVRKSIDLAVEYLKGHQQADGTWPNKPVYGGGLTPLCTLALLNAGCTIDDGAVARALKHLRKFEPYSTYTASLQTMVFCIAEPDKDRHLIERNVRWLESKQHKTGDSAGMWALPSLLTPDHTDNSMTHLAMLALYEAQRIGVYASDDTWRLAREFWIRTQNEDGSWGWGPDFPGSGSMTCAGIASLVNSARALGVADAQVIGERIDCCIPAHEDKSLERAFAWLTKRFSVNRNPGTRFWHSYYLYSLERAARITSRRFIGDHDWYREGAHMLVNIQSLSGEWASDLDEEEVADPLVSTSFMLMFLSKGRWPVVLAEVKHGPGNDWRHHGNSLHNLVSRTETAWNEPLSYQTVDISAATVEDLLQSPVLYVTGRTAPQFGENEIAKLRQYIDRGGFLIAHPSCDGAEFDAGFRALVKKIFPTAEYPLQLLTSGHPVWRAEKKIDPRYAPEIWGVETGCRTAVLYCPRDLACSWELTTNRPMNNISPTVRARLNSDLIVGMNMLTYCTNREVGFKDPSYTVAGTAEPREFERGKIYMANVLHTGGCDVAPGALRRILQLARSGLDIDYAIEEHEVALTDPDLFKYQMLFMHGRKSFELTPAERQQLKLYLQRGGTLLADAVCSSTEFTDSFRREMLRISTNPVLTRLPADNEVFQGEFGGFEISRVKYRPAFQSQGDRPATKIVEGAAHLEGLEINGRVAVFFSPLDLSCAIESRDSADCPGYVRDDAIRLVMNVLLYSMEP